MTPESFPRCLLGATELLADLSPRIAVRVPGGPDGFDEFLFGGDGLGLPVTDLADDAHLVGVRTFSHASRIPDASRHPDALADGPGA